MPLAALAVPQLARQARAGAVQFLEWETRGPSCVTKGAGQESTLSCLAISCKHLLRANALIQKRDFRQQHCIAVPIVRWSVHIIGAERIKKRLCVCLGPDANVTAIGALTSRMNYKAELEIRG